MAFNIIDFLKNLGNLGNNKQESVQTTPKVTKTVTDYINRNNPPQNGAYNPFVNKQGTLFNPSLNYQNLLDSNSLSNTAKNYISQATGLSPTNVTITAQNTQSTNKNIFDAAKSYIGTPYVWGGESMDEGGFDCSGFVYNTLKDAGYDVGRTTAQGYRNYGEKINQSDMKEGDLIFFGKNGKATHIGIYVGNGQMIHSSGGSSNTKSNPGKGVSIANISSRKDFLEARRYA